MSKFTQNNEEEVFLNFFKNYKGRLLDIGANNGITYSNSRKLILEGWDADLFEPDPNPYSKLIELYKDSPNVKVHHLAISDKESSLPFYVSETSAGLVSTLVKEETKRWPHEKFSIINVPSVTWERAYTDSEILANNIYDFISIDAEGMDIAILKAIDLDKTKTRLLCIEWNSVKSAYTEIDNYMKKYNFELIHKNAENLIYKRDLPVLLTILIPSTTDRKTMTDNLVQELTKQITFSRAEDKVRIQVDMDNRQVSIGKKRQRMLETANSEYVCFIDSDDSVNEFYVLNVLNALEESPDCVAINGIMTIDDKHHATWEISKDSPYRESKKGGKIHYLRHTNHLCPIKRNIALSVGYKDLKTAEDYDYAVRLRKTNLLKTEAIIPLPMYHYDFKTSRK
jgi:FkbM family methyltransferase